MSVLLSADCNCHLPTTDETGMLGTSYLSVYMTLGYRWLLLMPAWRHTYFPQCLRPRRICDIYDFFVPHRNVLTYLLTYVSQVGWCHTVKSGHCVINVSDNEDCRLAYVCLWCTDCSSCRVSVCCVMCSWMIRSRHWSLLKCFKFSLITLTFCWISCLTSQSR